ncbi:MAG: hypothetical protein V4616_00425 [Bacteroidota bacterium]
MRLSLNLLAALLLISFTATPSINLLASGKTTTSSILKQEEPKKVVKKTPKKRVVKKTTTKKTVKKTHKHD